MIRSAVRRLAASRSARPAAAPWSSTSVLHSSTTSYIRQVHSNSPAPSNPQTPSSFNGTPSDLEEHGPSQRPMPLNVQLTHLEPIKLTPPYGDLVAEITVSSFLGLKDVEFVAEFLMRAAFYLGIPARGPSPMPQKVKRWTVIRGPFVHAKSKENWERHTWRRRIRLYDANPETVQVLLAVAARHSLAGTGVHAVTYTNEAVGDLREMAVPPTTDDAEVLNPVDLAESPQGDVARAVLELLKDPRFATDAAQLEEVEQQMKAAELDRPESSSKDKK